MLLVSSFQYTRHDFYAMEKMVLETLDYSLTVPTAYTFMCETEQILLKYEHLLLPISPDLGSNDMHERVAKLKQYKKTIQGAQMILEMCLQNTGMMRFLPSVCAVAATAIAFEVYGTNEQLQVIERMIVDQLFAVDFVHTNKFHRDGIVQCQQQIIMAIKSLFDGHFTAAIEKFSATQRMGGAMVAKLNTDLNF